MEEEYEVVISGMSGRFPGCDDVDELKQSLFDKINLVRNEGRWKAGEMNVPHQVGTLKNAYAFDVTYFGIFRKTAELMDPNAKHIMECSVAAVHDAGVNMNDLAGSNTATITSTSINEIESDILERKKHSILMYANCMQANRVSYFMDLRGPSYVYLSDWNGGLYILQEARKLIATGLVKAAIVATSSVMFLPYISYHFQRLGRLNNDGKTKCFSDNADGYSRSESSVVFFLQRKEDAIRSYGTLLGVELSPHGTKMSSLIDCSEPDPSVVKKLYKVTEIDPSSVAYLEATGSASKVVDAEELNALAEIFLPKRNHPLPIGSVKSNLGHTESASVFMGLIKLLIAAESGMIPPNLHYSSPNKLVPDLVSNKLKVVTESTPLEGDYLALNNINGFGGYGHLLIKRNTKSKKRQCQKGVLPPDGLPRLVLLSAREDVELHKIIEKVENMPIDEEFIALTHRTFGKGIRNHMCRGYTILHDGDISKKYRGVQAFSENRRSLWVIFSGMGSQWSSMGAKLMKYPTFAKSMQYCHSLLEPMGVDLIDTITNPRPDMFNDILKSFVGITALQICLVDILKEVGIQADGIIGHSVGEIGCAYFDGSLTAEQAMVGSYLRGKVSSESKISGYLMAAVGIGYKELKDILPDAIDIACRNSSTSCTISGPADQVNDFMSSLTEKGVFSRAVQSSGIAYHSRYIRSLGQEFLDSFKKIVPVPKLRSPKWISSSVPEEEWDTDKAKYSSAEYHTNNILNPVLFEEALEHIPKDAVIIEVAPRGLLKAIIQRALPNNTYIPLTAIGDEGDITLLSAFGKLFNEGISFDIEKLYPPIEFPVSRGTPSLSPLFTWLHNEIFREWTFVNKPKEFLTVRKVFLGDETSKYSNLNDCKIRNVSIIPAALYLDLIIDMFRESLKSSIKRVLMENITFEKLSKFEENKKIRGTLQTDGGNWAVTLKNKGLSSGRIEIYYSKSGSPYGTTTPVHVSNETFSSEEIYLCLSEMGFSVSRACRNIQLISIDDSLTSACANILWTEDFWTFFDSVFTFLTFFNLIKNNKLLYIKRIHQIFMDFDEMKAEKKQVLKVYYNLNIGLIWTKGFELHLPLMEEPFPQCGVAKNSDFLVPKFFAFDTTINNIEDLKKLHEICAKIILSNMALDNTKLRKLHVYLISDDSKVEKKVLEILKNCNTKAAVASLPNDKALLSNVNNNIKNSYCFILNETNNFENTLYALQESQVGFLLCQTELVIPNIECIFKKEVENKVYFLYKTVNKKEKPSSSVMMSSSKWESELKNNLDVENDNIVYLVGSLPSVQHMHEIVKQCTLLENFHKIRFVFFEDRQIGRKFDPETYEKHLRKDLRINVCINELWGTYLFQLQELSPPLHITPHSREYLYKLDSIKADGINLKALGLNMADMTVNAVKLGVFEFSGTMDGRDVCGLATLNESTMTLELDPVFVWDKPTKWTYEDVTASLLAYTMAYYIVDMENNLLCLDKILVHYGAMPLCQAVIQLALNRCCEVFTTYDESMEEEYIRNLFPELAEKNCLKVDQSLYENIMARTNGNGIQVAVNTSEDERLLWPTALPVSPKLLCKMFQISSTPTNPGISIGLYSLYKNIHFRSFGPNCLLNLPEEEKKLIWELVNSGFTKNEIKPIAKTLISSSSCNLEAISKMKKKSGTNNKIVVSMKASKMDEKNKDKYYCDAEKYSIILGSENLIWYDLIQWLVSRGCKKFLISVNKISPLLNKRINVFLNQNKHLQINVCSSEVFRTMLEGNSFIKRIQESAEIGSVFIFGKEYCEGLNDLSITLQGADIVFIGNCVKMNLDDKHSHQRKCLIINVPGDESDLNSVIENMDSLINTTEPVLYLNECMSTTSGVQLTLLKHWEHLPVSASEIAHVASSSGRARWKEVKTLAPVHRHCKDVQPVFVLPSLKKGQFEGLIRKLFYPAFEAVIPEKFETFEELAQDLYKALDKFNSGVITIICADWTYQLGLILGQLLEKNGKLVSLILLGINNSWADLGVLNSLYSSGCKSLDSSSAKSRELFEKGFKMLKHRIQLVHSNTLVPINPKFGGFCHVLLDEKPDETSLENLKKCCQRRIKVHLTSKCNYLDMLNSQEAVQIINSSVLVEVKDRARPIDRDYDNFEIVTS